MDILLTIVHLLACFILVIVVLLQKGKGADLAGAFGGGGSQTALGVRSATQLIHKLTIAAAVFFMVTSYTLGMIQSGGTSLAEQIEAEAAQAEENNAQQGDAAATDENESEAADDNGEATDPGDEATEEDAEAGDEQIPSEENPNSEGEDSSNPEENQENG